MVLLSSLFVQYFTDVSRSVAEIALWVAAGFVFFLLFKKTGWADKTHRYLSIAVIYICLPLFFLSSLGIRDYNNVAGLNWRWLPFGSFALFAVGSIIALLVARAVNLKPQQRKLALNLIIFQNAGYIVLALCRNAFPEYPDLITLVPIFLIGYTPLYWVVSPYLLRISDKEMADLPVEAAPAKADARFKIIDMLNPPFISVMVAFGAFLLRVGPRLDSHPFFDGQFTTLVGIWVRPIGETSINLSMLVLGGALSKLRFRRPEHPRFLLVVILGKLLFLPLAAFLSLNAFADCQSLIVALILIESTAPPGVNIIVQARAYASKKTQDFVAEAMLYSYIVAFATLTLWMTILKGILD